MILESDWLVGHEYEIEIENDQDALIEVAFAYLRQRRQITYDQRFRCENMSPEEPSSQNPTFLDCSSYANAIYYEAFGYNVLGVPLTEKNAHTSNYAAYGKENAGVKADVIGYWEPNTYTTDAQRQAALDEITSLLRPGDLINYRHGKSSDASGHVIIYIGDGMFIHSTGRTCDYTSTDPEGTHKDRAYLDEMVLGTVRLISASEFFTNKNSSRYLMKNDSTDVIRSVTIIRPLANGLTLTEKTQKRILLAGLSFEKNVYPGLTSSVNAGGEISYVVTVENHSSNSYSDILFEDVLSEYLTFDRGNAEYVIDGQKISKTFSIGPFGTVRFRYTATVSEDAPAGAHIESFETSVGGIEIFDTYNVVSAYGEDTLDELASKALEYAESGNTYADPLAFAKALYKDVTGDDILDVGSSAALFEDVFTPFNETYYVLNTGSELSKQVVPRMYSGTLILRFVDIVAVYRESHFMKGDLIFCNTGSKYVLYVYVGDGKLVKADSSTGALSAVDNGSEVFDKNLYFNTILSAVRTYEKCVVIRPSIG